jgi:hypothetical protein
MPNRIAEELTGWKRDEAQERPVADVLRFIDGVTGAAIDNAVEIAMQAETAKQRPPTKTACWCDGTESNLQLKVK